MHDDEEEGGGVWPAYVAAVAGLLLSLLLLSAIMALVMFILGLVAGHNMDPVTKAPPTTASAPSVVTLKAASQAIDFTGPYQLTPPSPEQSTSSSSGQKPASKESGQKSSLAKKAQGAAKPGSSQAQSSVPSVPQSQQSAAAPVPKVTSTAPQGQSQGGGGIARVRIVFQGDALSLGKDDSDQLQKQIKSLSDKGRYRWFLALATQIDNPEKRRAGYLRLLAVRNAVIAAGVPVSEIDMRLIDTTEAEANNEQAVTISTTLLPEKAQ